MATRKDARTSKRRLAPKIGGSPQFSDPRQQNTAAQVGNTAVSYVPDINAGVKYTALAKSLGLGSKLLEGYIDEQDRLKEIQNKEAEEDAKKQAQIDYGKFGSKLGNMTRQGILSPNDNPAYKERISELQGKDAGREYHSDLKRNYAEWEGKNIDDPNAFQHFLEENRGQFLEASNMDDQAAYHLTTQMGQYEQQLGQQHVAYRAKKVEEDHRDALYNEFSGTIQEWETVDDVQAGVISLNTQLKNSYTAGLEEDLIKETAMQAIMDMAEENNDPSMIEIARDVMVGGQSLMQDRELKDALLQKQEQVAKKRLQYDDWLERETDKRKKGQLENISFEAARRLQIDPNDKLRDLVVQGTNIDPNYMKVVVGMQNAAMGTGRDDPRLIASYRKLAQSGNLPFDRIAELSSIGNINTLMSLQESATKRNNAAESTAYKPTNVMETVGKSIRRLSAGDDAEINASKAFIYEQAFEEEALSFIDANPDLSEMDMKRGLKQVLTDVVSQDEAISAAFQEANTAIGNEKGIVDLKVGGNDIQVNKAVSESVPAHMLASAPREIPWATETVMSKFEIKELKERIDNNQHTAKDVAFIKKAQLDHPEIFKAFLTSQEILHGLK